MQIEFLGRGVQIIVGISKMRVWLTAQEMLDLIAWARDHELTLAATAYEVQQEQRRQEHPPYYIGED